MSYLSLKDIFIEACLKLDVAILEPHLNEVMLINGLNKYTFLANLDNLFEELRLQGIFRTILFKRYCRVCHPNNEVLEFYGKKTIPVFAFACLKNKDHEMDLELCHNSWGYQKDRRIKELILLKKMISE